MSSVSQAGSSPHGRSPTMAVVLLSLVFVVVLGTLSWLRYEAMHTDTDLAVYSQVIWNTAHGDWFRNSVLPFTENYLGNHFTPILAAFAPLYALWPDPRLLLIAQVIINGMTAWPLFRLSREKLPTPWVGVLLVAALFLYPALHHQNLADFHGIALATPIVMLALYALLTRRDGLLLVAVLLMVLVREDVALVIIMMGLYAFLVQRRRRFGLFLSGLGIAASAVLILALIPAFRGQGAFFYDHYYSYLGDSPFAMVRTVFTQPREVLSRVFYLPKGKLLAQLLAPVAFLPLLVPSVFLLGGSALAYMLLVDFPFNHIYRLNRQYQALFIPIVFAGTVLAIARLVRWLGPRWGNRRVAVMLGSIVLLTSAISLGLWGPLSDEGTRAEFHQDERSREEWTLVSRIPPDASVVAAGRFTAPLSTRKDFYMFGGLFEAQHSLDYLIHTDTPVGFPAHPPALLGAPNEEGWQVPLYELVGQVGTTQLHHRREMVPATEAPSPFPFDDSVALRGATGFGQILTGVPGEPLDIALVWESLAAELPRLVFFVHLVEHRSGTQHSWASIDSEIYQGLFPTDRWHQGAIVGDVYSLDIPSWMPPGQYELHVGTYTREEIARLSRPNGETTVVVATVDISPPERAPDQDTEGIPILTNLSPAKGLVLRGHAPLPTQAISGQAIDLTLFWHATEPMSTSYEARFDLIAAGETDSAASWERPLVQGRFSNTDWQPGIVLADWLHLPLPPELQTGSYGLELSIIGHDGVEHEPLRLTTIEIQTGN